MARPRSRSLFQEVPPEVENNEETVPMELGGESEEIVCSGNESMSDSDDRPEMVYIPNPAFRCGQ